MNEPLNILVHKLYPDAKLPARKSPQAAGWDIYSLDMVGIPPGRRAVLKSGISMAIPKGYYGHLTDRSGLAAKNGITVLGGVIDSDYRGEIHVILHNAGNDRFVVSPGDRIAQIIFRRHYDAKWEEVPELPETERGEGGLGSTGK